ncbi:hypothetical protein M8C21_027892 [Ambrosia artemisiifolia]|uniref:RRM domain-containing protein n=1 Tax=Ambrosia artemisiifolia TaxID=4212 RepID=A0AAD5CTH6_AMBAR|nr:hypothetical protein M8C21_027892 [Ambrosia artemisiifolia]
MFLQHKYYVFVKNLPFFSSVTSLEQYFTSFGDVEKCILIDNGRACYTRTAKVKMVSKKDVKKILKQEKHYLDGKQIQVMKYFGMATHKAEDVEGKYHLLFDKLIDPNLVSISRWEENNDQGEVMTRELEDAFHQFEYTRIHPFRNDDFLYTGYAQVTFKDSGNASQILAVAQSEFGDRFRRAWDEDEDLK